MKQCSGLGFVACAGCNSRTRWQTRQRHRCGTRPGRAAIAWTSHSPGSRAQRRHLLRLLRRRRPPRGKHLICLRVKAVNFDMARFYMTLFKVCGAALLFRARGSLSCFRILTSANDHECWFAMAMCNVANRHGQVLATPDIWCICGLCLA